MVRRAHETAISLMNYSHRKVVLKNDQFSSALLTRRKTQTMQRIGETLQRRQRRGGEAGNFKTTSRWLYKQPDSILYGKAGS